VVEVLRIAVPKMDISGDPRQSLRRVARFEKAIYFAKVEANCMLKKSDEVWDEWLVQKVRQKWKTVARFENGEQGQRRCKCQRRTAGAAQGQM